MTRLIGASASGAQFHSRGSLIIFAAEIRGKISDRVDIVLSAVSRRRRSIHCSCITFQKFAVGYTAIVSAVFGKCRLNRFSQIITLLLDS